MSYITIPLPVLVDGSGNIIGIDLGLLRFKQVTAAGSLNIDIQQNTASNTNRLMLAKKSGGTEIMEMLSNGTINNSSGIYGTLSDIALKEIVGEPGSYLEQLRQVRLVKYKLKADVEALDAGEIDDVPVYLGVIAQEFEQVFPGLVSTNEETGLKSVKTGAPLQFMLLQAVQEICDRLDRLEATVQTETPLEFSDQTFINER